MNRRQIALVCTLWLGIPSGFASAQTVQNLSLQDAEKIAIQNHPRIQAAMSLASAATEQVREVRSAYYPTVYGSLTGVDAENNSRVTAGGLNNPIIFERYANGITVGQLLTDFGRTHELAKSSNLHAQAQQENVVATRADVLLRVDQAYFSVLKAQAVLRVAEETVKSRQLVSDQVTALAKSQIKSGLDVSFANVDLAQARLLLVQAQNDLQASFADLSSALGFSDERTFVLSDETSSQTPPANLSDLIQQAVKNRPELIGQRLDVSSAQSYATAERDLWLPSISAVGTAGLTPYGADALAPRYAAVGFNVNVPLFNGHLFGALHSEANFRAHAQEQYLRDLQNRVVRDVRTAWLNANSAFQRLALTDQLLKQATDAVDLAQARYKLGLSSIIELSQAQLNMTQAELESANSKYDYETQLSVLNYQIGSLH
ncbi:MAG: TolC family protein [Acidobacteriia bacterium]|nr:TolC family protein [Terriglobia bacterium]